MPESSSASYEEFVKFSNYRDLTEDEKEQIELLLEQAARQISSYLGTINWVIEANPLLGVNGDDGGVARDRQLHIVKRYFDNQQGFTAEAYDGYSASMDDRAYEGLRLTPYDKEVLNRSRKQSSRVQTKSLHRNFGYVW